MDQFFARNPTVLLNSPHEPATLNPDNIHVLRGHLLCAAMEITLNSETWTVGGGGRTGDMASSTGQAHTFDDSKLWGDRYFDAAHSLLETQDLVVAYAHHRVRMRDDIHPTHPPAPETMPLPLPLPLPLWRMHPLHRLGSVPSKDVSLRLIDPITINVSTQLMYAYAYAHAHARAHANAHANAHAHAHANAHANAHAQAHAHAHAQAHANFYGILHHCNSLIPETGCGHFGGWWRPSHRLSR